MPPESGAAASVQPLWVQALVAAVEPRISHAGPLAAAELSLEPILNALPVAISLEDWSQNKLTCSNQRALEFWGAALAGRQFGLASVVERIYPPDRVAYQSLRQELVRLASGASATAVLRMCDASAEWRWVSCWLTVLANTPAGLPQRVLWCMQDITEDKRNEERLRQALYFDPLTGLYNRAYFDAELNRLSGGREYPVGIIMIDVDSLKQINDSQGHAAGDALLQRMGTVLKNGFRHGDVVARIGGDEFAVLLPHASYPVAREAVERIAQGIYNNNRSNPGARLEISLGLALAEQGQSLQYVLKIADQRMYQQKLRHKQQH